jgi:hypothetical protein
MKVNKIPDTFHRNGNKLALLVADLAKYLEASFQVVRQLPGYTCFHPCPSSLQIHPWQDSWGPAYGSVPLSLCLSNFEIWTHATRMPFYFIHFTTFILEPYFI